MAIDCVLIGDTIALNLQNYLQCAEVRAAPNLSSSRIINIASGNSHQVCIISAGSYDYYGSLKTMNNIKQIRDKTTCKFYVWVIPANNPTAGENVEQLSRESDDQSVDIGSSTDNTTPTSYKDLAANIINKLNAEGL